MQINERLWLEAEFLAESLYFVGRALCCFVLGRIFDQTLKQWWDVANLSNSPNTWRLAVRLLYNPSGHVTIVRSSVPSLAASPNISRTKTCLRKSSQGHEVR